MFGYRGKPARDQRGLSKATAGPRASQAPSSSSLRPSRLEPGGKAARQLYDTAELWAKVLVLLDKKTLAVLLRVERAVTAGVAAVLYKRVHVSMTAKMSRINVSRSTHSCLLSLLAAARREVQASGVVDCDEDVLERRQRRWKGITNHIVHLLILQPRRSAYCDAVRELDLNPPPSLALPHPRDTPKPQIRFDAATLLLKIGGWRTKYPNLQRINYLYPANEADDAYLVHLTHDPMLVELESHVQLEMAPRRTPEPAAPSFLPMPTCPGMQIRHTIAVQITTGESWFGYFTADELRECSERWIGHLYRDEKLDRRVTSIQVPSGLKDPIEPTFDEAIAFLSSRRAKECEPIAKFFVPKSWGKITLEQLGDLSELLGSGLRVLHYEAVGKAGYELQSAISLLDSGHPNLHEFRASYYDEDSPYFPPGASPPLSGMQNLRKFVILGMPEKELLKLARWVRGLGSEECTVVNPTLRTLRRMTEFNAVVRSDRW